MNSSPFDSWEEFSRATSGAMYTFYNPDEPWIVIGICFLVLAAVVWFVISAYRFEDHRRR